MKYLSLAIALALCAACGLSLLKNATNTRNIILDRKHETTIYDSEGNSVSESKVIEGSPYEDIMGITDMFLMGFLFGHGKSPFLRLIE